MRSENSKVKMRPLSFRTLVYKGFYVKARRITVRKAEPFLNPALVSYSHKIMTASAMGNYDVTAV